MEALIEKLSQLGTVDQCESVDSGFTLQISNGYLSLAAISEINALVNSSVVAEHFGTVEAVKITNTQYYLKLKQ